MNTATLRRRVDALENTTLDPSSFAEALREYRNTSTLPRSARVAQQITDYWGRVDSALRAQDVEAECALIEREPNGRD